MNEHALPPPAVLINLITGKFLTQAVSTVAELRLADQLKDGPLGIDELAKRVEAKPGPLYRLMRALAMVGVFTEHEGRSFSLTPVGSMLRTDVPGSLAGMARFMAAPWHSEAWFELTHCVRTGESGFPKAHGAPLFQWADSHPDELTVFNHAMTSFSASLAQAVLAAFDFKRFAKITDVGGGHGMLLASILKSVPSAKGTLFDLPKVVSGAKSILSEAGVTDRCEIVGGSFFDGVPKGADAYVLKHIIHDWSDDDATRILSHCAAGLVPNGRVLLVEMVLPGIGAPSFGKIIDLEMLVMTSGGLERTEAEFRALLAKSGLTLESITPTQSPVSVLEAKRA